MLPCCTGPNQSLEVAHHINCCLLGSDELYMSDLDNDNEQSQSQFDLLVTVGISPAKCCVCSHMVQRCTRIQLLLETGHVASIVSMNLSRVGCAPNAIGNICANLQIPHAYVTVGGPRTPIALMSWLLLSQLNWGLPFH